MLLLNYLYFGVDHGMIKHVGRTFVLSNFREPKNEVEERSLLEAVTPKAIQYNTKWQGGFLRIGSKTEVTRTPTWSQWLMRA